MSKRLKIIQTSLAVLVLLLVTVNILIGLGNQSIQAEVGERQQMIAQTMQLENLNRQLITVLANLALKTNDEQLKKLLAESGINLSAGPEGTPPPAKK
jgi:predicted Holliday junction resolvase-like endonuclease